MWLRFCYRQQEEETLPSVSTHHEEEPIVDVGLPPSTRQVELEEASLGGAGHRAVVDTADIKIRALTGLRRYTMAANVVDTIKVENGRLIIDVALKGTKLSASGKNVLLFSTQGNIKVDGVTLGINAYRKA